MFLYLWQWQICLIPVNYIGIVFYILCWNWCKLILYSVGIGINSFCLSGQIECFASILCMSTLLFITGSILSPHQTQADIMNIQIMSHVGPQNNTQKEFVILPDTRTNLYWHICRNQHFVINFIIP